jgi:hypothetical protein
MKKALLYPMNPKIQSACISVVVCMAILSSTVQAQKAGNWAFSGGSTAGTAGSHITVSNMTVGSDIGSTAFNGTDWYGQDGWPTAATIDPNADLIFTLTANSGYYLSLTQVNLSIRLSTTGTPSGSGPTKWVLKSSLDGYSATISSGTLTTSYVTYNIALSSAYQSIPSTVTFHLYGYSSVVTSGGSNRFVTDSISVNGTASAGTLAAQDIQLTATSNSTSGQVNLLWNALGFETGTSFIAERSTDGTNYTDIDRQTTGSGNDTNYAYQDTYTAGAASAAAGTLYYRIRAEQPDGSVYLSSITTMHTGSTSSGLQVKGITTAGNTVKALVDLPDNGLYQLTIYSMDGKALYRQMINGGAADPSVNIAFGQYPRGVYVLSLANGTQRISRSFLY